MKRKINLQFLFVICMTILVTMILLTTIFTEIFKEEVMEDLSTYTMELKSIGVFENMDAIEGDTFQEFRVTLVKSDGVVIYDNYINPNQLQNHGNRPEIRDAIKQGYGQAIRKSETLNKSNYYYAVKLENGCVLRLAKESENIWSILMRFLPYILVLTIVLVVITIIIASFFTRSIIKPIEKLANDMEHMESVTTYKELQPFIDTIVKQHGDILRSAIMRQEFTANVSHELKTPLTAISGYAEIISNGMADEADVARFANEIHRNSNRLLSLINDIIHLSELDVMDNAIEKEEIDLNTIVQTAVDMLQLSAGKRQVRLTMSGVASIFNGDKMMIEELVYNLINNAIRYNKQDGTVHVEVYPADERVVLCVTDTGIGIPKEHQERIFERFYRVDKSHSKQTGGTGLGLAIVKHIVAKHNGDISLESEYGKGTKITVWIPV